MYIRLADIEAGLRRVFSVQSFNIRSEQTISGIDFLPDTRQDDASGLSDSTAYLCGYQALQKYEMSHISVPLICVVDPHSEADMIYFKSRCVLVIYHSSVTQVMLELNNVFYYCGTRSSVMLDLSTELLSCRTLDSLMAKGFEILANPLIVTNAEQRVIAHTPPAAVLSPVYEELVGLEHLPVGHPTLDSSAAEWSDTASLFSDVGFNELPSVMCRELRLGNTTKGYLHLLDFNHPIAGEDRAIMEMLGNLITIAIWVNPDDSLPFKEKDSREKFIRDILDNKFASAKEIEEQQERLGLLTMPFLYVVIIKARSVEAAPRVSLSDLSLRFTSALSDSISFPYRNSVFLVHYDDDPAAHSHDALEHLRPLLEKYHLIAGVSNPITSLAKLRDAGYQANNALFLGSRYSQDAILFYKDFSIDHMIRLCLSQEEISSFIAPEIIALIDYCSDNNVGFLNTLRVYIENNCSKSATAKALYTHINTLKYQLERIETIMGISIKENNNPFRLMLSFKLLDYIHTFAQDFPVMPQSMELPKQPDPKE